jgi:hypothetical protein
VEAAVLEMLAQAVQVVEATAVVMAQQTQAVAVAVLQVAVVRVL